MLNLNQFADNRNNPNPVYQTYFVFVIFVGAEHSVVIHTLDWRCVCSFLLEDLVDRSGGELSLRFNLSQRR